jgi:hypothetical protein
VIIPAKDGAPEQIINGEHDEDGLCCVVGMLSKGLVFVETGGTGKCSVCGACYVYGDVWKHEPSGEFIHIGHDCAHKYSMLTDRSEWELSHDRLVRASAIECQKAKNLEERLAFLKKHDGLEDALAVDHRIIRDIAERFASYRSLSDKQIALVFKLANEVRNPTPVVAERHCKAPNGRTTFIGKIVSTKVHESMYGETTKMTVKVITDEGCWLAWGTVPASIDNVPGVLVGREVEITATLEAGREPHFVFMKRPRGDLLPGASGR